MYRRNGTRFQPGHTRSLKRSGRKTVPVWAWMSGDGAGEIHRINGRLNGEQYIDVLENSLIPSAYARYGLGPIRFVQDRSPIHTCNVVQEWFEQHPEIELIPWPAKGADFNPIENVWSEMVRDMDARNVTNPDDLWSKVTNIWGELKRRDNYWVTLSDSMVDRLRMAREIGGEWTKY